MHCCIPTPITDNNTSTGMIRITLNMPSAAEECYGLSGKCKGIVGEFQIGEWSPWLKAFSCLVLLCLRYKICVAVSVSLCVLSIITAFLCRYLDKVKKTIFSFKTLFEGKAFCKMKHYGMFIVSTIVCNESQYWIWKLFFFVKRLTLL